MNHYTLTLKSDNGKHKLGVVARNYQSAIAQVMNAENCPESAIIKIVRQDKPQKGD